MLQREPPTGPDPCFEGSALAGVSLPFVRLTVERGNPHVFNGTGHFAWLLASGGDPSSLRATLTTHPATA